MRLYRWEGHDRRTNGSKYYIQTHNKLFVFTQARGPRGGINSETGWDIAELGQDGFLNREPLASLDDARLFLKEVVLRSRV